MASPAVIKEAFERNKKAVTLRPSLGKSTAVTKVRIRNGTTCEIKSGSKTLVCDIGKSEGGNDAGPGPGIFERAALGSCLAIGYSQRAAVLGIPVDKIEVDVETNFDARGMLFIDDRPPGFEKIRYNVHIESSAAEEEIRQIIEDIDKHSPVLDDFRRPIPVERKITIVSTTT